MGNPVTTPGQPMPMKAGEFENLSQPSVVTWALKNLQPPEFLYVSRDDQLVMSGISYFVSETITLFVRMLTIDGVIVPMQKTLALTTTGTSFIVLTTGVEGFLLSAAVVASGAYDRGQTFVRVWLNRGTVGISQATQVLIQDYCTLTQPASFPTGGLRASTDGAGFLNTQGFGSPAAGADFTIGVPAFTRWRISSIQAQFVTSAAVANRQIEILVSDSGGNTYFRASAAASITASTTARVTFTPGSVNQGVITSTLLMPLPSPLIVKEGDVIRTLTTGIQAGDQWGTQNVSLEQWIDHF